MSRHVVLTLIFVFALFVAGQLMLRAVNAIQPQLSGAPVPAPTAVTAPRAQGSFAAEETVIARGQAGQFHLPAQVNGKDMEFLIDTGADLVALTVEEADRLRLDLDPGDFQPIVQTASGPGKAARVRLDRIELGGEELRGVDAVVVEGLQVNLLGQSALRRLGKVELRGDRMVIAHR